MTTNAVWDEIIALNGGKGNVLAVTSGHDHGESWCARSKDSSGIPICFNGHSGYGGYVTEHSAVRNGRVFNLNLVDLATPTPTVKTWNSCEFFFLPLFILRGERPGSEV